LTKDLLLSRYLLPLLAVLMMAGAFWSRGLLSTSVIIFIALSIIFYGKDGWKEWKNSIWLMGLVVLFMVPFLSRIWSDDHYQWWRTMQTKIPLLLLPFCAAAMMKIPKQIHRLLLAVLVLISFIATLFSYWTFFSGNDVMDDYLKAKVVQVPMSNDHVRFAWLLLVMYIFLIDEWMGEKFEGIGWNKWMIALLAVYFAIYFHVLATKTGLLGFYLVSVMALIKYGKRKYFLPAGMALLCLPLLAWALVPSFRNRVKFVVWDYQNYSRGNYTEGLSDAPRILSYKAGMQIVREHPLSGTGAGDVLHDSEEWYAAYADYLKPYERLLPSNEILYYSCAAGIIGGGIALCIFLYPFFMKMHRHYFSWISFHAVALMGFLYEIGLEVQYGVFIFGFMGILLYCRIRMGLQPGGVAS
jgi:O-antigen ligase